MLSSNNRQLRARRQSRVLLVTTCLLATFLLLALAGPLLFNEVYVGDDLGAYHLPARAFYAEQLAAGESFDWWPQIYGGMYLTGEGQLGSYHPVHWLLYRILPLTTAFGLEVLLSYVWMFAGMVLLLRRMLRGRSRGNHWAALFGATLFTFSGFNLLHLFHVNAVAVVSHIPWLLLAIDVALRTSDRRRAAWAMMGVALLTASQLLLGYPQYVWYSLLTELAYAAFVLRSLPDWSRAGYLAVAKLLGLMIGAVQLLPTYDALSHSVRSGGDSMFAETGSLHPLNLVQLVSPYLFQHRVVGQNTHELGLYFGAVPLVLLVWLFTRKINLGRFRSMFKATLGFALLAFVLALGTHGYLYSLQTLLPVVGKFRFPCRMIVLVHLAVAVLSTIALLKLAQQARREQRETMTTSGRPLYALVVVSGLLALAGPWLWPGQVAAWPLMVTGPILIAAAVGLLRLAERRSLVALAALLVLGAVDLGTYGMSYTLWQRTETLDQYVDQTRRPTGEPNQRVVSTQAAPGRQSVYVGNQITLTGFSRIDGYAGLQPAKQLDYRQTKALQVAGVGWVREQTPAGSLYTLAASHPLPRFRLVTRTITSNLPQVDLEKINVATTVLTSKPVSLSASDPGKVKVVTDSPGRLYLKTNVPAVQLLATTESYHAGWQASIDGIPAEVVPINGDFLGCLVPAGEHAVHLEFRPESLRIGKIISVCGVGLLGCFFLLARRRHSKITSTETSSQ